MIILGIDPGTTRIGYGVVKQEKNHLVCVGCGILKTPHQADLPTAKNGGGLGTGQAGNDEVTGFKKAAQELDKLIKKFRPDCVGIEKLFFFKNQKTVMAVSEMRGALLLTLSRHGIPIREFTPLQVKQSLSGYGRADKAQVQRMVRLILNIKTEIKPDDAADALAIAICCANTTIY